MTSPGLTCLVLGSAAGGGFPQWNCACRVCALARAGDPAAPARTQMSVAVSADRRDWLVIGASPDLRQQILDNQALHPRAGLRDSPILGVVLVSADIDGIAGLLVLREQQPFRIYAPQPILDVLRANAVFDVLDPRLVERMPIAPGQKVACGTGLFLTLLELPGKVPLYHEDRTAAQPQAAATYAARVEAGSKTAIIAPGCAEITDAVRAKLAGADLLLFDGTLFTDDEMIAAGVGTKTGRRMGHIPVAGPDGSLARLAGLKARRVFVHINNTNPMLVATTPERRMVEEAGFEVGRDGMEIRL
ncbi:MAG TPA: pyrroloquinoline quinone biosynthesis protein PqqB [Acetobacteraceae bacterium]|nr:pyrroloquinoline quinone biosynthesis protein PqqB [Acetobacteraceae bacterium]